MVFNILIKKKKKKKKGKRIKFHCYNNTWKYLTNLICDLNEFLGDGWKKKKIRILRIIKNYYYYLIIYKIFWKIE